MVKKTHKPNIHKILINLSLDLSEVTNIVSVCAQIQEKEHPASHSSQGFPNFSVYTN